MAWSNQLFRMCTLKNKVPEAITNRKALRFDKRAAVSCSELKAVDMH